MTAENIRACIQMEIEFFSERSIHSLKDCADRKLFCCFFIVNINWFMLTCIVRSHMHFSPIKMLSFSEPISTRAFLFIRATDTLHPAQHLLRDTYYRYSILWPQASSNLKKKDLILGQRRLERGQRDRNAYDVSLPRRHPFSLMLLSANYPELVSSFTPVVSFCLSLICPLVWLGAKLVTTDELEAGRY